MTYGKKFKRIAKLVDCGISTSKTRDKIIMEVIDERGLKVADYVDTGKESIERPGEKILSRKTLPYGFVREDHYDN